MWDQIIFSPFNLIIGQFTVILKMDSSDPKLIILCFKMTESTHVTRDYNIFLRLPVYLYNYVRKIITIGTKYKNAIIKSLYLYILRKMQNNMTMGRELQVHRTYYYIYIMNMTLNIKQVLIYDSLFWCVPIVLSEA